MTIASRAALAKSINLKIAKFLRVERERLGLTLKRASEISGFSIDDLRAWELCLRAIQANQLHKLVESYSAATKDATMDLLTELIFRKD